MRAFNHYLFSILISLNLAYLSLCYFIYYHFKMNGFFLKYALIAQIFQASSRKIWSWDSLSIEIIFIPIITFVLTWIIVNNSVFGIEINSIIKERSEQYLPEIDFISQKIMANVVITVENESCTDKVSINENNLPKILAGFNNDAIYSCSVDFLPQFFQEVLTHLDSIKLLLHVKSLNTLGYVMEIDNTLSCVSNQMWNAYLVKIINVTQFSRSESFIAIYNKETAQLFNLIFRGLE